MKTRNINGFNYMFSPSPLINDLPFSFFPYIFPLLMLDKQIQEHY